MNEEKKLVSIIMPVYNSAKYIKEAVESIINQTYSNWELLVINEYLSDKHCTDIINYYSKLDSRIILIQNKEKLGISESINTGIRFSKGEYIARMDADDISLPFRLEKQVNYLNENKNVILCGTRVEIFGSDKFDWNLETNFEKIRTDILFYSPCVHPTIMFRRELFEKYEVSYNKDYKASEDYDFFSKTLKYGDISNIDEVLFKYRIYGDNATYKNNDIGLILYNKIMNEQFLEMGLKFTDDELKLLSVHFSLKGSKYDDVLNKLINLDLLLKKILVSNYVNKIYKQDYIFKTLHKRFTEAYNSISWSCTDYNEHKVKEIYEKSIFYNENFYVQSRYAKEKPDISVLLPTYNSEKYIADTLLSILNQSFSNFELIVINEYGTEDNTLNILKMFKDNRIKVIQNDVKLGLAESLNKGINESKGKYIARIDADDLAIEDRFQIQYDFLENNLEYSLCGTWQRHFSTNIDFIHKVPLSHDDIKAQLIYNCEICHSTIMFRKKDFVDNYLYYDSNAFAEDYELWTRAIKILKFANLPYPLGEYRIGDDNITPKKMDSLSKESGEIAYKNINNNLKVDVPLEHIKYLSGWRNEFNNIKNKSEYERHLEIEKQILMSMWENNKKYKTYDDESLLTVINRRWKSVTNSWVYGTELPVVYNLEEVFHSEDRNLYENSKQIRKQSFIKRYFKNFLMFFYRPFKYKIVDKIRQQLWDLDGNLKDSTRDIRTTIWDAEGHIKDEILKLQNTITLLHQELNFYKNIYLKNTVYFEEKINILENSLNTKIDLFDNLNSKISNFQENLGQQIDARIWKAEENLGQQIDARIWKAEENLIKELYNKDKLLENNFYMTHKHIDFTYRDIMIILSESMNNINKDIKLDTNYPIAYNSNDHLIPHGTIRDNTRYPRFIRACEQYFLKFEKKQLSFLDLGCSGGGMVLEALLKGHISIGLEGSDASLKQQRAEWRLIPNNLFTCDITKPFNLYSLDEVQTFDVISAWEVLEHILEEDLDQLIINIKNHLSKDGIFIASIADWDDIDPVTGVNWHVNQHPYDWWKELFIKYGFDIITDSFSPLDLARGTINPSNCYELPYEDYDLNKTFYIVVSKN